jgi:hypothetical protein
VFCGECLFKWLHTKNECPTCRKPAEPAHRLRVINNAVEKLASRVLDSRAQQDRAQRRATIEAKVRAQAEEAARQQAQKSHWQSVAAEAAAAGGAGGAGGEGPLDVRFAWKYCQGQAQFGAGCTLFKHLSTGLLVEVFHGNGWYRFRTEVGGPTRWCNSCGNLGHSDLGAPNAVAILEGGGGEHVPQDGTGLLDDSGYWLSRIEDARLVLSNSDDETLHLSADGSFVWLSHPGINRAVVIRNGVCSSCDRAEGTSFLSPT